MPAWSKIGAGEGNRTLVISLEGFCSAIELHPHTARLGRAGKLAQLGPPAKSRLRAKSSADRRLPGYEEKRAGRPRG